MEAALVGWSGGGLAIGHTCPVSERGYDIYIVASLGLGHGCCQLKDSLVLWL